LSPASFLEKKIKSFFWFFFSLGTVSRPAGPFRMRAGLSVLALRPDRLGDFILSTPALQVLERGLGPTGRLTLVAGEGNETLARFFFPGARILVFRKFFLFRLLLFIRLWLEDYDLTLDFHSYPFSTTTALMTLLSGSPERIGFWAGGESQELSRRIFNRGVAPPGENLHEMEKGFLLLEPLGLFPGRSRKGTFKILSTPWEIRQAAKAFYRRIGAGPRSYLLAVHPTLQKEDNRWSQENYLEFLKKAGLFRRCKILVVHGRGEEPRLQRFKAVAAEIPNLFVLPQNDILFILEAAKRFDAFVCNDSGLMHLGALVTQVLALFGPSDPRRWGPLMVENFRPKVLRKKDHQCDSIRPAEVALEIQRRIRSSRQV
jgi:ADP-heptose:LPS heptosyltransferase